MKFAVSVLFILLQSTALAAEVKLSDVKKVILSRNLELQSTALQVYQAKTQVRLARANLLPRLNISRIASSTLSVGGAVGMIEDIAPFLFPSNWIKIKEVRFVSQASEQSFEALKLNQIYSARATVMSVLADQIILKEIGQQNQDMQNWLAYIQFQEKFGQISQGTSTEFERLSLETFNDSLHMSQTFNEEISSLKYLLNISQNESLTILGDLSELVDVPIERNPDWAQLTPETLSFDNLIQASRAYRRGFAFSFLGFTSNAVGLSGGAFDMLSDPNGLGFGMGPSLRIGRAQTDILTLQRGASVEAQEKALSQSLSMIETQGQIFRNVEARLEIIERSLQALKSGLRMGRKIDEGQLFDLLQSRTAVGIEYTLSRLHWALSVERKQRILNQIEYKID